MFGGYHMQATFILRDILFVSLLVGCGAGIVIFIRAIIDGRV